MLSLVEKGNTLYCVLPSSYKYLTRKQCKEPYNRRLVRDSYQEGVKLRLQDQSCIDQKDICGAWEAKICMLVEHNSKTDSNAE